MAFRSLPGHVMGWELMVVVLLAMGLCLLLNLGVVEGGRDYSLTREKEMELDRQLKILNKPAIKSIESDGDIFDCVDINKQPAFDHPSLKNHNITRMPGSYPKGWINESPSTVEHLQVGFISEECPSGTVPIRRTRKEDLIREILHPIYNEKYSPNISTLGSTVRVFRHIAVHESISYEAYGVKAHLNIYGLPNVSYEQFSSSGIGLNNGFSGPQEQINSVQAGWMVQPRLYGDSKTRLYGHWTANGYHSEGCYNQMCPGFVQISTNIPLGMVLEPLSSFGGQQYELVLQIYKDPITTNWWLLIENTSTPVGYWPKELFTDLADHASQIDFGGVVGYVEDARGPAMGNGHYSDKGPKPCYVSNAKWVDKKNHLILLNDGDTDGMEDKRECYKVSELWKGKFFFGGPQGCNN